VIDVVHIAVCMKPTEGNFAQNALEHGVAGINVDACRVSVSDADSEAMKRCNTKGSGRMRAGASPIGTFIRSSSSGELDTTQGRWPANVLHDGSEEVVEQFPVTTSGAMKRDVGAYKGDSLTGFLRGRSSPLNQHGDSGSAARFFKECKDECDGA
jgi:site-specific DNA-methyltransferase (adenine-specific)